MNNKNIVSIVALLLVSAILMLPLVSCSQDGGSEDGKIDIVTTVFPVYDWVREILGDKTEDVNLTLLLDSGVDLHSYQPSTDDIIKISSCDMLVYVGGTSDDWLDDILKNVKNKNGTIDNTINI
jgi:zinc transport system substrate-binding protein